MEAILDFITSTPKPVGINNLINWSDHPISFATTATMGILVLITIILGIYAFRAKKTYRPMNEITVAMPSMKELEAREAMRER